MLGRNSEDEYRAGETLRLVVASRTDLLRGDVSHGYEHYGNETYLDVHRVVS